MAEHRALHLVALEQDLADGTGLAVLRRTLHHRVFQIGIELLTLSADGGDAALFECLTHLPKHHFHAAFERIALAGVFARSGDGALQIVNDRQKRGGKRPHPVVKGLLADILVAAPEVFKVRLHALGHGQVFFLLGDGGSERLGRFGGAVAMQNKVIEETKDFSYFYMDNYYLKTLVEMGYLGLAFFILLLFGLVLWSLRSIGRTGYTKGDRTRMLAVSMFAGMCGVLVHCYFENIFEVPYMMAYFWSMAAAVMYLGYFRKRKT